MTSYLKFGTLVAGVLAAAATTASAAMIDFTDTSIYGARDASGASGTVAGLGFSITGNGPLFYEDGPGAVNGLVGDIDGIGIGLNADEPGADEVNDAEYLTLTFDRKVRVTGVYFLDLFRDAVRDPDAEHASFYEGTPPAPEGFIESLEATEVYAPGGLGFGSFVVSRTGTTFTFDSGVGNDGIGLGDFALAGVSVAAIPLPASVLLLGGALGGLGVMGARRRRS